MRDFNNKQWIMVYAMMAVLFMVVHYLLALKIFDPWHQYIPFLNKLSMSLFLIALIFLLSKIIERVINSKTQAPGDRYNLLRIIRFLALISSLIVVASFLFQNLYAAAVSFG